MVYVRSRKFCCCLPVRFGVFCEALIGIAIGGLFAVGGWLQIHSMRECSVSPPLIAPKRRVLDTGQGRLMLCFCRPTVKGTLELSHTQKISLWCLAVSMTIFTLSSLLG